MGEVQFSDAYSNEYQVRPVVEEVLESLYILHLRRTIKEYREGGVKILPKGGGT